MSGKQDVIQVESISEYQNIARSTAVYPEQGKLGGLLYTVLGLVGEAGELANQAKKILRDDNGEISLERQAKLIDELGDVLWYVANLSIELGWDLTCVADLNLQKLHLRAMNKTLKGDKRE